MLHRMYYLEPDRGDTQHHPTLLLLVDYITRVLLHGIKVSEERDKKSGPTCNPCLTTPIGLSAWHEM